MWGGVHSLCPQRGYGQDDTGAHIWATARLPLCCTPAGAGAGGKAEKRAVTEGAAAEGSGNERAADGTVRSGGRGPGGGVQEREVVVCGSSCESFGRAFLVFFLKGARGLQLGFVRVSVAKYLFYNTFGERAFRQQS